MRIFRILSILLLLSASFARAQSNTGNTMNSPDTGRPTLSIKDDWLFNAASNPLPACNPASGRVSRAYVSDQTDTTCTNNVPYVSGGNQGCEVVCLKSSLGWRIIGSATSSGGGGALRTVYVNNTASCPGTGTATAQYCTIQNALTNAQAGDDIRIQKTASEYVECDTMSVAGTQAHPIVIESDNPLSQAILSCHTQSANAQIYFAGTDYVTIQNLTWDGVFNGVPQFAIAMNHASGSPSTVTGDQVLNNTINGWGASNTVANADGFFTNFAIEINEAFAAPQTMTNPVISGNTITNGRGWGINVGPDIGAVVSNNTISGIVCGTQVGFGTQPVTTGIELQPGAVSGVGGEVIKGNTIQNFTGACSLGSTTEAVVGIHCDGGNTLSGAKGGVVTQNTVYNISAPNDSSGGVLNEGILIEAGCPNWLVTNNLVNATDLGNGGGSSGIGIFVGTADTTNPPDLVYNNTVANTNNGGGFRIDTGKVTLKDNIFYNNATQIQFNPTNQTPPTMVSDYNSLWDTSGGNNVGAYNSFANVNFATWKTDTSGDSHSLNSTPNMISPVTTSNFNLKLNVGSNAIGAGIQALDNNSSPAVSVDFRNLARPNPPTIGAYEGAN